MQEETALTLQVQSLQRNMPDLLGMRDRSKQANFPVIPLVAVDFLFRNCSPFPPLLAHVTQLCSCDASLFAAVLNGCGGRSYRFGSDAPSLSWQLFQGSFTQSQLRVFMWFLCWQPVTDLFLPPGCGAAGDPCRARSPPALCWGWGILLLPSLSCPVSPYISLFISVCVFALPAAWHWVGFVSLSLQCKYDKGKWYHKCCFLTWQGGKEIWAGCQNTSLKISIFVNSSALLLNWAGRTDGRDGAKLFGQSDSKLLNEPRCPAERSIWGGRT